MSTLRILFFILIFTAIPAFSLAASPQSPGYLIVCDPSPDPSGPTAALGDCHFDDLIRLGVNIMNFLIVLSTAVAAIVIAYAGFLYLSSAGDEGNVKKAKGMLTKVAIGFFFLIAAWVIVNEIIVALLDPNQPGLFILKP